jgi:hypothetical protein
MSPFLRNLGILAAVALVIVLLNAETALATATVLLKVAFFIVIAIVVYLFWRDVARHEIGTWGERQQRVFYAAVALLVVDIGWWMLGGLAGRNLLIAVLVAAACAYAGYRTWRDQRNLV